MSSSASGQREQAQEQELLKGLARAFAGALIFALPMLMTMEMWWLGFYVDPFRLALMLALTVPVLVGISRFSGLRPTSKLKDDLADALVAVLVAAVAAALTLYVFALLKPEMPVYEIVGRVALQTVPASFGAMLARSQLGGGSQKNKAEEKSSYGGELFLMGVGALYLSFNVAPTQEMVLIPYKMSIWHELGLVGLSLLLMHAIVYAVDFRGQPKEAEGGAFLSLFARFTLVGYAIVLLVSAYVLWTFERTGGLAFEEILSASIVLGFPGAIGAAAARVIL